MTTEILLVKSIAMIMYLSTGVVLIYLGYKFGFEQKYVDSVNRVFGAFLALIGLLIMCIGILMLFIGTS